VYIVNVSSDHAISYLDSSHKKNIKFDPFRNLFISQFYIGNRGFMNIRLIILL
jgi:hypothetical protein